MSGKARAHWILIGLASLAFVVPALAADKPSPAVGRWDITLGDGPTPCWLEVTQKGDSYNGRFLLVAASVYDLKEIKVDGDKVEFKARGTKGEGSDDIFKGTVSENSIEGTYGKDGSGNKWSAVRFVPQPRVAGTWTLDGKDKVTLTLRQPRGGELAGQLKEGSEEAEDLKDVKVENGKLKFAVKDEAYEATVTGDVMKGVMNEKGGKKFDFTAKRERRWGEPIELFNGKDLEGWKPLGDANNYKWKVVDGLMHCDGQSANIVSERTFRDFKLHVEFRVPQHSNSGVYLRGRYEIQVADSAGEKPEEHGCGALYSRIAPSENAGKPAGEWQTYDITLIGQYLTVVWNGKTVIDNKEVEGITGGAMDSKETEPGPIYLQGDHAAVDYRKITVTPGARARQTR